jgi:hypothetical protein
MTGTAILRSVGSGGSIRPIVASFSGPPTTTAHCVIGIAVRDAGSTLARASMM